MVSVLILSWNHEKYIEQCINSVINQTYRDIEIIYVDNNSSDNTFVIAENILRQQPVKFHAIKRNAHFSIAQNLNFLFNNSHGDYICFISGDDWLYTNNIDEKIKWFDGNPSLGVVDSGGVRYYEEQDIYEPIKVKPVKRTEVLTKLLQRNFLSGQGAVIKREVIEKVGMWDESLLIEDWDMWIRIAGNYDIIKIDKPLFYYREHQGGISKNIDFMYKAKMQVYNKHMHLNTQKKQTEKNIWETYIAGKVQEQTSLKLFFDVLKRFRPNIFHAKLLIKSLIPVSWKKWYLTRSIKKRNKHIHSNDFKQINH